eukprot:UN01157
MGVLGDTEEFSTLNGSVNSDLSKALFVLLELIVLVTMLNALISHMGDIYDRVRAKSAAYQSLERLTLCLELLRFLPEAWVKDIEKNNRYR